MQTTSTIIISLILMTSCGENQQAKVCECSKLTDEVYEETKRLEGEGMLGYEAGQKAKEKVRDKLEECENLLKEIDKGEYYKMFKKCD